MVCLLCYICLRSLLPHLMPKPVWNIFVACRKGDSEALRIALSATSGPDVNCPDSDGYTPLMLAALHGHTEACLLLLFNGALVGTQMHPSATSSCMHRTCA